MSIVAVEISAEAAGWARRRQQQQRRGGGGGRQVTEGFSRAGFSREETDSDWDSQATVLDEEPEEGDTDDK